MLTLLKRKVDEERRTKLRGRGEAGEPVGGSLTYVDHVEDVR